MTKVEIPFETLIPATFARRDNRFRVRVQLERNSADAHLPNSGRLGELLLPGQKVWLAPVDLQRKPHRRTSYDLALVEFAGRLVSLDARLPGHLVAQALRRGQLEEFAGYKTIRREVRMGASRLDFHLDGSVGNTSCWIEVKSVTLVENGTARFPDAPTVRGQRHVRELVRAVANGDRAAVIFVVQREDAQQFAPHDEADPDFGMVLRQAAQAGVEVHAWRCQVSLEAIRLLDTVPVTL